MTSNQTIHLIVVYIIWVLQFQLVIISVVHVSVCVYTVCLYVCAWCHLALAVNIHVYACLKHQLTLALVGNQVSFSQLGA